MEKTYLLGLYAQRLENIDESYRSGKMTKITLKRELRALIRELKTIIRHT